MPRRHHDYEDATLQLASHTGRKRRGVSRWSLLAVILCLGLTPSAWAAAKLNLGSSGTGFTISGSRPAYTASFGTMDALAFETPVGNVSASALPNNAPFYGAIYFTTLSVSVTAIGPNTAAVAGYVSSNFTGNAASGMVVYGCAAPSACTTAGQFSALGTSQAGESTLATGLNGTTTSATVGLAIFLPDNDGATAFTGTSASGATVSFDLLLNGSTTATDTVTLALTNETVHDAVQLTLATSTGGLTLTNSGGPLMDPFFLNFGNVNALGIGPGSGLSTSTVAGGIVYSTPYLVQPVFTDFVKTTSTVTVYVFSDFVHPAILELRDSSSSGGPYNAISKVSGTPTQITATAADRSAVTEYLGLFVSNINGATAFTGTDSATLTYTLTVP